MILVTGGTGLVGSHLLFHLAQAGNAVRATYRTAKKLEDVRLLFSYYSENSKKIFSKIQWIEADLNDISSLERAFENITHVYHCAALISFDPNDFKILQRINETGTANLVNMCISRRVSKLCYVSSIAAIGKSMNNSMVTEDNEWRFNNSNPYALTKHLAEMEVWRGTQEGVPAVIVNPGVILGPGFWESGSGKLFHVAAKGSRYYPPGGTGFVTVQNVVRLMIELMNSEVVNQRFIAVGENFSYSEILSKLSACLGANPPRTQIKFWQLKLLWRLDWLWNKISGQKRKLSKSQVVSLANRGIYDNTKAKKLIGFEYLPMDDYLPFCCLKFREAYPALFS